MMRHLGHRDNTGGVVVAVSCRRPATSPDGGHWWWRLWPCHQVVVEGDGGIVFGVFGVGSK